MKYFIFASGIGTLLVLTYELNLPTAVMWFWGVVGAIGLVLAVYNDMTRHGPTPQSRAQNEYLRRNESPWLIVIAIGVVAYVLYRVIGQ